MGDRAKAEALRIAYEKLSKDGWKFNLAEVGWHAADILKQLEANLGRKSKDDK